MSRLTRKLKRTGKHRPTSGQPGIGQITQLDVLRLAEAACLSTNVTHFETLVLQHLILRTGAEEWAAPDGPAPLQIDVYQLSSALRCGADDAEGALHHLEHTLGVQQFSHPNGSRWDTLIDLRPLKARAGELRAIAANRTERVKQAAALGTQIAMLFEHVCGLRFRVEAATKDKGDEPVGGDACASALPLVWQEIDEAAHLLECEMQALLKLSPSRARTGVSLRRLQTIRDEMTALHDRAVVLCRQAGLDEGDLDDCDGDNAVEDEDITDGLDALPSSGIGRH